MRRPRSGDSLSGLHLGGRQREGIGWAAVLVALVLWQAEAALGLVGSLTEFKLLSAEGERGDLLGWSVAVDGDWLAVGAVSSGEVGAVYVFERGAEGWSESTTLGPAGDARNTFFGNSVALEGDTLIVGAPRERQGVDDVGAVYVFRLTGGTWQMQVRLIADDGAAGDRFGESVSVHGARVVVGAPGRDELGENAGAAYVFVESNDSWSEEAVLVATEARPSDLFGSAVAAGHEILVVGAPTDAVALDAPGTVHVFELESKSWVRRARLRGPTPRDLFGLSVAASGRTVVVGAPRSASALPEQSGGSVHVFEETDSGWTEQAELSATGSAPGDRFGFATSISGGTIVASAVGSCSIDVFRRAGVAWQPAATVVASDGCPAAFGRALAVAGRVIAAGTPSDGEQGANAGATYVYETSNPEVILGPGHQIVVAGEEAALYLTFASRRPPVASLGFDVLLPSDLRLEGFECRLEADLARDFELETTSFPDSASLRFELRPVAMPPSVLPRDGLFARCSVRVDEEVEPGTRPLTCDTAHARNAGGNALATRCEDGELTILAPCPGDCDASGDVSVDELLIGIRVAFESHTTAACRTLDQNRDQLVSVDELVSAVSSALFGCAGR